MILLSHTVLIHLSTKSIIPLESEVRVRSELQLIRLSAYWANCIFIHTEEEQRWRRAAVPASPERTYLFHPAVQSLVQPSELDGETNAFSFLLDMKFCGQS